MAEETYEIRFESEGLHIIPVASQLDDQEAGVVAILPQCLQDTSSQDTTSLLLNEIKEVKPESVSADQSGGGQASEPLLPTEPPDPQELVIQHGLSWFNDIISNIKGLGESFLDFPVFCNDGISWSSKVILASIYPTLKESLVDDSCLVLPDFSVKQFSKFHDSLLMKSPDVSLKEIISVARAFGLQYSGPFLIDGTNNHEIGRLDYEKIFRVQREEYIKKIIGNSDVGSYIFASIQLKRSSVVSDILCETSKRDKENIIDCESCGRHFQDEISLKNHRQIVHESLKSPDRKSFSCKHCKKQFAFKVNLKRHMYLIHPNVNFSTLVNSPTKSVQDYMEDSPELTTENNKSQDEFPKLDKFKCKICGVFCKSKRYLVAHIQSHFGGGYKCDYPGCTSVFKENAKLKRHKLVHTGEKAFKCKYCGLMFSLRHNLKTHEKTHTREDLLKCRLCPYETIQKSNLKLHEATHERGVAGRGKSKGKLKTPGRQPRRAALDDIDDDFDEIEGTIDEIMDAVGGDS